MKCKYGPLTQGRLKELLYYDPETGLFTWRVRICNRLPGMSAGTPNDRGYLRVQIDKVFYRAHHLAWLYMTGVWPPHYIDHIDMNKSNNRWTNLRAATKSQNQMNTRLQSNSSSGYKGVHWYEPYNKWQVQLWKDGKAYFVGYFDDPYEGHLAYVAKAKELFGDFARAS